VYASADPGSPDAQRLRSGAPTGAQRAQIQSLVAPEEAIRSAVEQQNWTFARAERRQRIKVDQRS
jgi:hypothetical protein